MTMLRSVHGDFIVSSLQQILHTIEPNMQASGSVEQTEELLLRLEEIDENFHKHDLVKYLKQNVNDLVSSFIDKELEGYSVAGSIESSDQGSLVSQIVETVTLSEQFAGLLLKLRRNISEGVTQLISDFDWASISAISCQDVSVGSNWSASHLGDEEGSVIVFNDMDVKSITDDLGSDRNIVVCREAMRKLNKIITGDIYNNDHWTQLKKHLVDRMADPDEELSNLTLKFLAKSYSCTSHHNSDVYSAHVEFLQQSCCADHVDTPSIEDGISCLKSYHLKNIKYMYLLNQFQRNISNCWIRYPTQYCKSVILGMLSLLSVRKSSSCAQLLPVHYVSIIDPHALWFTKWMHCTYSRCEVFKSLKDFPSILYEYDDVDNVGLMLERLDVPSGSASIHKSDKIEQAVQHCLTFSTSRKDKPGAFCRQIRPASTAGNNDHQIFFSLNELHYAHFLHSASFLTQLLHYQSGRAFFPFQLKCFQGAVTVTQLMKALLLIVVDPADTTLQPSLPGRYEVTSYLTELLKHLCSNEQTSHQCLLHKEILGLLLLPVTRLLHNPTGISIPTVSTLTHVAELLHMLASSQLGKQYLIHEEMLDIYPNLKSTPASVIAEFTKSVLLNPPPVLSLPLSPTLVGAYMSLCQQLYGCCEGLSSLSPHCLHTCFANALHEITECSERSVTPTPTTGCCVCDETETEGTDYRLFLQDVLLNSLTQFAITAKGVLLLQQAGCLGDCVRYMCQQQRNRLQEKTIKTNLMKSAKDGLEICHLSVISQQRIFLQIKLVSKCNGVSCGYILSQLAATAPGMMAMLQAGKDTADGMFISWRLHKQHLGYISDMISDLWTFLESMTDCSDVCWTTHLSTVGSKSYEYFCQLAITLSSFPAVYETLQQGELTKVKCNSLHHGIPESIPSLLERLVFINTDDKMQNLFNYEQSHCFGLRLLSLLVSSLDCYLHLQSRYHFEEMLLDSQAENRLKGGDDFIIDMLSLERNYILVRCYLLGGPTERVLPPRTLTVSGWDDTSFPLFSSFPAPSQYTVCMSSTAVIGSTAAMKEINKMSSLKDDMNQHLWLDEYRSLLVKYMTTKPHALSSPVIQELLRQSVVQLTQLDSELMCSCIGMNDEKNFERQEGAIGYRLSSVEELGVDTAVRYGHHVNVICHSPGTKKSLTLLLERVGGYLRQQQTPVETSMGICGLVACCDEYDVRLAVTFQRYLPPSLASSGIQPLFCWTGHCVELVLQLEDPVTFSAFKMSGYTPAQICEHWLRQCWWGYFDWSDIERYVLVVLLMGVDYQVYVCVAVLHHLHQLIFRHQQSGDLISFLKEGPIHDFHTCEQLAYMLELEKRHRHLVLGGIRDVVGVPS